MSGSRPPSKPGRDWRINSLRKTRIIRRCASKNFRAAVKPGQSASANNTAPWACVPATPSNGFGSAHTTSSTIFFREGLPEDSCGSPCYPDFAFTRFVKLSVRMTARLCRPRTESFQELIFLSSKRRPHFEFLRGGEDALITAGVERDEGFKIARHGGGHV